MFVLRDISGIERVCATWIPFPLIYLKETQQISEAGLLSTAGLYTLHKLTRNIEFPLDFQLLLSSP